MIQFTCDELLTQLKKITGQPYKIKADFKVGDLSVLFDWARKSDFNGLPENRTLGMEEFKIYQKRNPDFSFGETYVDVDVHFSVPDPNRKISAEYKAVDSVLNFGAVKRKSFKTSISVFPEFSLNGRFPLDLKLKDGSTIFENSNLSWRWKVVPRHEEDVWNAFESESRGCNVAFAEKEIVPASIEHKEKLKVYNKILKQLLFTQENASAQKSDLEEQDTSKEIRNCIYAGLEIRETWKDFKILTVDGKSDYQVIEAENTLEEAFGNIEKSR